MDRLSLEGAGDGGGEAFLSAGGFVEWGAEVDETVEAAGVFLDSHGDSCLSESGGVGLGFVVEHVVASDEEMGGRQIGVGGGTEGTGEGVVAVGAVGHVLIPEPDHEALGETVTVGVGVVAGRLGIGVGDGVE